MPSPEADVRAGADLMGALNEVFSGDTPQRAAATVAGLSSAADWDFITAEQAWAEIEPVLDETETAEAGAIIKELISNNSEVRHLAAEYALTRRGEIGIVAYGDSGERAKILELALVAHTGSPVPAAILGLLSVDTARWSRQSIRNVAWHAAQWGVAPGCENLARCVAAVAVAAGLCPIEEALERYSHPGELATLVQVAPTEEALSSALDWLEGRGLLSQIRMPQYLEHTSRIGPASLTGTTVAMASGHDRVEWVLTRSALSLDEIDEFVAGMNRVGAPDRLVVLCRNLEDSLVEHTGMRAPALTALRRSIVANTDGTGAEILAGQGGVSAQRDAIALTDGSSEAALEVLCGLLPAWQGTLRDCIEAAQAVCTPFSDAA